MRLLICAGGTGGGVYPALAVLQALENKIESFLWVGGKNGMEADLIKSQSIPYTEIPAAGVHGVGLRTLPGNLIKLLQGIFASRRILNQFKPDAILFTGGYVAAPMAIAARRIPSLLFVPDIEPGMALKFLAGYARKIAVTTDQSQKYFKDSSKLVITGYPTRTSLTTWDKQKAKNKLDLHNQLPVILFLGGSKGARSINNALMRILPQLLKKAQVIHITGQLDWKNILEAQNQLDSDISTNYHVFPYLHEEMGAALSAANLVVSRAGASSLGEYPLFGLPAILVPYPHAWRYQKVNAEYLINQQAALLVSDEELPIKLLPTINSLLENPEKLSTMQRSMANLASPDAAEHIANLVLKMKKPAIQEGTGL